MVGRSVRRLLAGDLEAGAAVGDGESGLRVEFPDFGRRLSADATGGIQVGA